MRTRTDVGVRAFEGMRLVCVCAGRECGVWGVRGVRVCATASLALGEGRTGRHLRGRPHGLCWWRRSGWVERTILTLEVTRNLGWTHGAPSSIVVSGPTVSVCGDVQGVSAALLVLAGPIQAAPVRAVYVGGGAGVRVDAAV